MHEARAGMGRGQNTKMGGSDPTAPRNRGPVPSGFGGHSRRKLLRKSQPVFWPRGRGAKQRICKTARNTKLQGRNKKNKWQSSKHRPSNRRR
jgi:hypothetical protein